MSAYRETEWGAHSYLLSDHWREGQRRALRDEVLHHTQQRMERARCEAEALSLPQGHVNTRSVTTLPGHRVGKPTMEVMRMGFVTK